MSSINIDENYDSFVNKVIEVLSSIARRRRRRAKKGNSLVTSKLQNLMMSREALLKQYLKSGLPTDKLKFKQQTMIKSRKP